MLKLCRIEACANGTLGLHLSRAPWDPYPWVSGVQKGSSAHAGGMRCGDTVLELNGGDVLGQKISEIAARIRDHWHSGASYITVIVWRNKGNGKSSGNANGSINGGECAQERERDREQTANDQLNANDNGIYDDDDNDDDDDDDDDDGNAHHSINQQSLQKFATCLQNIAQLLECPVCLEVTKPPGWQCCNGHVLCNNCRSRSEKCPVCRVPLGPRGRCLLSDKLFTLLAESFPCDSVKGNKAKSTEKQKCTQEFHNRPKMAASIEYNQQQQQQQQQRLQQAEKQQIKAKDIKKKVKSLYQQQQQQQQHQQKNKFDKIVVVSDGGARVRERGQQQHIPAAYEIREEHREQDKLPVEKVNDKNLRIHCKTTTAIGNNNNNKNNNSIHLQRKSRLDIVQQQQQQQQLLSN